MHGIHCCFQQASCMAVHESKAGFVEVPAACSETRKALQTQLCDAKRDNINDRHFRCVFGLLRHVEESQMRTVLFTAYVDQRIRESR
jgi:hypothetical protein